MAITAHVESSEVWEQQLKNKKFTVYKIIVEYGQQSWMFYRRYNEFTEETISIFTSKITG
ncbi:hypothetical protein BLA29_006128 [Euroglyphus maynei]|uniref:Uncharacterized protein n=1 Tax=Euroglyphus maynei TaxID=6958 RepID=A0A1Y3AWT3_EURMA|nr:hypothetical protein BLA29_006128 [Euroglyphus maynei]